MKKIKLTFLFCLSSFSIVMAQEANRYTSTPQWAQYNPMSTDELIKIAQLSEANAKSRKEAHDRAVATFSRYQDSAYQALMNKNYYLAIDYCNQALGTNLSNSNIYLIRAAGYFSLGLDRDAKKDLKIAAKMGSAEAKIALRDLKKK